MRRSTKHPIGCPTWLSATALVTLTAFTVTFAVPEAARAQAAPPTEAPPPVVYTQPSTPAVYTQQQGAPVPGPGDVQPAPSPGYQVPPPAGYPQQPGYPPQPYAPQPYAPQQPYLQQPYPQQPAPQQPYAQPPPSAYPYYQPYYAPAYTPPPLRFNQPKMHVERKPRYGLMVAGLSFFLASYLGAASAALTLDEGKVAIPVAGPIWYLVEQNRQSDACPTADGRYYALGSSGGATPGGGGGFTGCGSSSGPVDPFLATALVINSLAQAAGVIMFFTGAFTKTRVVVKDRVQVAIQPVASPAMSGVTAVGTF